MDIIALILQMKKLRLREVKKLSVVAQLGWQEARYALHLSLSSTVSLRI